MRRIWIIINNHWERLLNIKGITSLAFAEGECCGVSEGIDLFPRNYWTVIIACKCLLGVFMPQDHPILLHIVDFSVLRDALLVAAVVILYGLR